MDRLDERLSFFVLQNIFLYRPRIGADLLREAEGAAALFRGSRRKWRDRFGGEAALFEAFARFDGWGDAERGLRRLEAKGIRMISLVDEEYPPLLREISDPPLALFLRGKDQEALWAPCVAIVGSRKGSEHGRSLAARMAEGLSRSGVVVVSGLAYGIDAAAHRGALAGPSGTIAVLGCGPDIIYPAAHRSLFERILEEGLILSEFPPGRGPQPFHFPQRNRLIAGLSIAAVVIEAAERSGSLITARFALEAGREVMACPGRAGDPNAAGAHGLLKSGAALVESAEDVLELLAGRLPAARVPETSGQLGSDVDKDSPLLRALRNKDRSADELASATGMGMPMLLAALTDLVLSGAVAELPGHRFRLGKGRTGD